LPFVLDASVTASWLFPDEQHPAALEARRRTLGESVLVPLHWWFEIRNTLLFAERRGRISERLTSVALDQLSRLPIEVAPQPNDNDVLALARRHHLTFYDAAYLELAFREHIALATLDGALRAAAVAEAVEVISGD